MVDFTKTVEVSITLLVGMLGLGLTAGGFCVKAIQTWNLSQVAQVALV